MNLRRHVLKNGARVADTEKYISHFIGMIVFPGATGVLGAFTSELWKYSPTLCWIAWLLLLGGFAAILLRNFPAARSFAALAISCENLERHVEELEFDRDELVGSIELQVYHNRISLASIRLAASCVDNGELSQAEFTEFCGELLSPLYLDGGTLFGFSASECWNFAVYLYSEKRDALVPIWREKSAIHPSQSMGREWAPGQGHIGKAFVDTKPLVTKDAYQAEVAQFCTAPRDKEAAYDSLAYRSFASIPIGPMNSDKSPYGVLVASSDVEARFDKENTAILLHNAETMALVLALTDTKIESWFDRKSSAGQTGVEND